MSTMVGFIRESNAIEGIHREPHIHEIEVTRLFLSWPQLTIPRVQALVHVYQPNARLRVLHGMDVRVGRHVPPAGGPEIRGILKALLSDINAKRLTPYEAHHRYETLHPFTDGNGRSGRAIWLWQMGGIDRTPLGFLHHFYYQALQEER